MRLFKRRLAVDPAVLLQLGKRTPAGPGQHPVDMLTLGHGKSRMCRTQPFRKAADHLMIGQATAWRIDELWSQNQILMAAALVDVVMF